MTQSNQNQNYQDEENTPSVAQQTFLKSLDKKVDKLGNFSLNVLRVIPLWRLVGYALLFLFLMDVAEIVIPPSFLDPQWEFNVLGQIVERIPIPLLGFLLIFYGGNYLRQKWENWFLKIASWLTLVIGILFILAVPLGIIDTFRIDNQTQQNITDRTSQSLQVLQEVENQLGKVQNAQQMQVLIAQLNRGNAPRLDNPEQLEQVRTDLKKFIDNNREELKNQANTAKKEAQHSLMKRSIKWNIGALLSGALFIMFWKMTKWAREANNVTDV